MASDLRQQLQRLSVKAQMFTGRYRALADEKTRADARIAELKAELARQRAETQALRRQLELLKVAGAVAPDKEDIASARVMISEILREIDKCIDQLTH